MTGVDKDLATVREVLDNPDRFGREAHLSRRHGEEHEAFAALDRVEAALARLREERDAAREHSRDASEMYVQAYEQITELLQQQSFMERKLAAQREDIERLATRVETAEAEVERLRSDKDERDWRTLEIVTKQAEAAEARCARLQQALEEIRDGYDGDEFVDSADAFEDMKDIAREALAGPDTPADKYESWDGRKVYDHETGAYLGRAVGEPFSDGVEGLIALRQDEEGLTIKSHALCAFVVLDTPADSQEDEWFIPEGDRQCGVVHKMARATCMKRRGHDGSHATPQGTWIDGPWCEYPADSPEEA